PHLLNSFMAGPSSILAILIRICVLVGMKRENAQDKKLTIFTFYPIGYELFTLKNHQLTRIYE
ncbi:MAG: hypothetical protein WCH05_03990, partial [Chlorobiaceae bacterium]